MIGMMKVASGDVCYHHDCCSTEGYVAQPSGEEINQPQPKEMIINLRVGWIITLDP